MRVSQKNKIILLHQKHAPNFQGAHISKSIKSNYFKSKQIFNHFSSISLLNHLQIFIPDP